MANLTLYIDTTANALTTGRASAQSVDPASVLPLYFGDTISLIIYLLTKQKSTTSPNAYDVSTVSTAGLQLFLYINDGTISGTIYTQQITWTTDAGNTYFSANLALNTVALQTLIGSSTSGGSCFLKIGYVQNGVQTTVLSKQITVGVGLPTTALVVPAGQTALSAEVANSTYFPLQPVVGGSWFLKSPAGVIIGMRAIDNADGSTKLEPYIVS